MGGLSCDADLRPLACTLSQVFLVSWPGPTGPERATAQLEFIVSRRMRFVNTNALCHQRGHDLARVAPQHLKNSLTASACWRGVGKSEWVRRICKAKCPRNPLAPLFSRASSCRQQWSGPAVCVTASILCPWSWS